MSTMTISPAFMPSSTPRLPASLRLTRRGRLVVVMTFLALAGVLMVAFGGLATATRDGGTPEPVRVIQVAPGDTLYAIAGEVAKPGHIRDMVAHIQQLNSMSSAELQVGQRLAVPTN